MNRHKELIQQYNRVVQQFNELELEYQGQKRGNVYIKRKMQLQDKADGIKKKLFNIGVVGNICHIQGKRSRPNRKNPQIMVQERFNLYFVNISEEEASALVKLHVRNIEHYTVTFIKPGKVMVTS